MMERFYDPPVKISQPEGDEQLSSFRVDVGHAGFLEVAKHQEHEHQPENS